MRCSMPSSCPTSSRRSCWTARRPSSLCKSAARGARPVHLDAIALLAAARPPWGVRRRALLPSLFSLQRAAEPSWAAAELERTFVALLLRCCIQGGFWHARGGPSHATILLV